MNKWKAPKLFAILLVVLVAGCASSSKFETPRVKTSAQFQLDTITVKFEQLVTPEIEYHGAAQIEKMLREKIAAKLAEKGLLTGSGEANKLSIEATYVRRFFGDSTALPTDSLAYPNFAYKIILANGDSEIARIEKTNLSYKGGIAMNLQVMAGTLRDKKYEIEFIEAFANTIVAHVEAVRNP